MRISHTYGFIVVAYVLRIAENFRFIEPLIYAVEQVKTIGRILEFRTRSGNMVLQGGKYYGKKLVPPWKIIMKSIPFD